MGAAGVYVRLGKSGKTSGDKPGQAALKEQAPAERPRESPAQGVVAGQDKKGSGAKEKEPPKTPEPVAKRVPKKTAPTPAKEEKKPKTKTAAPPAPRRRPKPPNFMPEMETLGRRLSVQGPTETARRAARPKPPPGKAARPGAGTGAGGSKGAEKTTSALAFSTGGGGRVGTTSGNRTGEVRELNYVDQVLHWLKGYGSYPREARMFRLEDTVTLKFAINRQGKILYYTLVKKSEWHLLNMAVRQMMDRAGRVPPIPPEIAKNEMTFTVPVQFTLRSRS
jgi:protein TonB